MRKYVFSDVLQAGMSFDPSRVTAQIVTGIGFIGAGIIFVRRNDARGSRPPPVSGSQRRSARLPARACAIDGMISVRAEDPSGEAH